MSNQSSRIVYLNGEFLPIEQASISVMDRGFLFGDSVYEVIPVFNGILFRTHEHLQRLQRSLNAIDIKLTINENDWRTIFTKLLQRNVQHGLDQALYLQITRGVSLDRRHTFSADIKPTVFAQCTPFKSLSFAELTKGAAAITLPDTRWQNCFIKSTNLLPNILAAQTAKQAEANEAILLREGKALEGSSSNLFIVSQGIIKTPPLSEQILGGITREFIIELSKQNHLPYQEIDISEQELRNADEIWMSGSIKEILPIVSLDDHPVGTGKVGPVWHTMYKLYQHHKLQPQ